MSPMPNGWRAHPGWGPYQPGGWVPAPRYLLRRAEVLTRFCHSTSLDVLELGCGAGALAAELARAGHRVTAIEPAAEARRVAATLLPAVGAHLAAGLEEATDHAFDRVLAFEVLEHMANELDHLRQWSRPLRPGGELWLSVPADPKKWSRHDEWAGHRRRYHRRDLEVLLSQAGLEVVEIANYGFPVGNLVRYLRVWATPESSASESVAERTARSGVERSVESRTFPLWAWPPGRWLLALGIAAQRPTASGDRGVGFLARARLAARGSM